MKKIKVISFVFSLLMFMPYTIKAKCNYNERNKLQTLANNLNFTYNYKEINTGEQFYDIDFSITISNFKQSFYVIDQTNAEVYYYNNKDEITIDNYDAGSTIEFVIYANEGNCIGEILRTNYVTLPPYNQFYKDPICNDVAGYKLCNRWSRVTLSYDEFVTKVKKYKDTLKQEDINQNPLETDWIEKIIEFLSKYSFYLFGGIIVICSGLIFYLKRKDEFDLN